MGSPLFLTLSLYFMQAKEKSLLEEIFNINHEHINKNVYQELIEDPGYFEGLYSHILMTGYECPLYDFYNPRKMSDILYKYIYEFWDDWLQRVSGWYVIKKDTFKISDFNHIKNEYYLYNKKTYKTSFYAYKCEYYCHDALDEDFGSYNNYSHIFIDCYRHSKVKQNKITYRI